MPGRLQQSLSQLAQELKSIPVDWAVHGTPPQLERIHPVIRVRHTWPPWPIVINFSV